MSTLLNVPPVSQLTPVTGDGKPSENAQMDCTAACVDMLCRYVLGTPENSIFNPDNMKDHAYSDAYIGGTAAVAYVAYCQTIGVHLYSVDVASYEDLVQLVRSYIRDHNHPCIFTRDDPYVDQRVHPGWTHACLFKGQDDTGLTAHDPYINQPVYKTDAGWIAVLREKQIWIAERIQEDQPMPITINSPEASGFKEMDANHWQCTSNGHIIQYGLLADYKQRGYSFLGIPWSNELSLGAGHALQYYQYGVRQWLNGVVSSVDLYTTGSPGQDPRLATAWQQIQQLQAQLAAQPTSAPDPRIAQYASQLQQIGTLSSQIDTLSKVS